MEAIEILLNSINRVLLNNESNVLDTCDINDEVVALAKKHSLLQFISEENMLRQTMYSLRQEYVLKLISEKFEAAGIDYIPLKGSVVKNLYPQIWMRSSGDIDILVHEEDMDKIEDAIEMELIRKGSHCWEYNLEGVIDEIHFRLINNIMIPEAAKVLGDGWLYTQKVEGHKYEMRPEAFYLYHLAHMAVHIFKGGCGIRSFVDIYFIRLKMNIDENKLAGLLDKAGLADFEKIARNISDNWISGKYTATEIENFIIRGGAFGAQVNGTAFGQAKSGGKFINMIKRIFLTYTEMKYRYPILEKCPYLLPVCWIRYWVWVVKSGKLSAGRDILLRNAKISANEYDDAKRILNGFGL